MILLLALGCGTTEPGTTTPTGGTTPPPVPTTPPPVPTTPAPTASTASTGDTVTATGDTSTPTTTETTLPDGLHGIPPAQPVPPINFVATNRDGTLRDQTALLGQPTILWFYPAAGTGG